MNFGDITFNGTHVELLPMEPSHKKGLLEAAKDGELWKLWYTSVPNANNIDQYIQTALLEKKRSSHSPSL